MTVEHAGMLIQVILFGIGFLATNWMLKHGSSLANLIINLAFMVTCLVLAYTHTLDEDRTVMWVLCFASVFYVLSSYHFFNKMVPTIKEEGNE